jgi:hypothetical protein
MLTQEAVLLRLRVDADADAGALARVLERFQNLDIVPRRIIAEFGMNDTLHVQVDILGLSEERLTLIASKIGQVPSIISAYWHRL